MNPYPILAFVIILVIGFTTIYRRKLSYRSKLNFAIDYREEFIKFSNSYFESYDRWTRSSVIDHDPYIWLTKNVNQVQSDLGPLGIIHYVGPFQSINVPRYQVIINTVPKFRNNTISDFDVSIADDCLIRHIGNIEDDARAINKKLNNPMIWFKEGFRQFISIPVYILNAFGILSGSATQSVLRNKVYSLLTGIGGLITFFSGVVTIIGQEKTYTYTKRLLNLFNIKI